MVDVKFTLLLPVRLLMQQADDVYGDEEAACEICASACADLRAGNGQDSQLCATPTPPESASMGNKQSICTAKHHHCLVT